MSFFGSILGDLGIGSGTGPATASDPYTFSQQQKDFIKLQFKYGLLLKKKLAAGEISQAYYDANFWLTTQTLEAPYNAWWDEFKSAIDSEDLNWLAKQVGETVDSLTNYMGDALRATAAAVGKAAGTIVSSATGGLASGFFGSLDLAGWAVVAAVGFAVYYGYKHGYVQALVKKSINPLL